MNRPPRSLHLPARNPSSWTNFVVRVWSPLRGLSPPSWGVVSALRVALSRAARIPVLTRVRRILPEVTRLRRGDARGVNGLVVSESRRGVRARVRALGLFSRPGVDAIGLERGPTLSASAASADATSSRAWPPARRSPTSQPAACLEPSGVVSKSLKDPSVVIRSRQDNPGPLAVLPFTSPAAKIKYDDANDLCENSLQFSTNVSISVFLCRK